MNETKKAVLKGSNSRASASGSDPGEGPSHATGKPRARATSLNPPGSEEDLAVHEELDKNEFIVERIMGYKQINRIRYARVKWLGFPETSWEPADGIFLYQPGHKNGRKSRGVAESLHGRRRKNGKIEYKVHWKGQSPSTDVWIRETTLARPDLVEQYCKDHGIDLPIPRPARRKHTLADNVEIPGPLVEPDVPVADTPNGTAEPADSALREAKQFEKQLEADPLIPPESPLIDMMAMKPQSEAPAAASPIEEAAVLTEIPTVAAPPRVQLAPISEWSVSDLSHYLTRHGFASAADKLQERGIDGNALLAILDPAALRQMDIPLGPSLKIVKLVRDLRKTEKTGQDDCTV